ncbi:hypothetical protein F4775DRAFT_590875 [Biscogniauxia sp. FL1348]|nr:hypothetical protein F4775DRAFT_590875 [Biscogniauxia sp. FL1348]
MPSSISCLPESTTQLLGSHGVITSPVSLVKELLDNSIDAKATSVEVIISADTVSRIEVRDNGVGIHPDDYDALGRRSHTSKIRNFQQLRMNTGVTLGFRGEALASANCMATITITTKTAVEPVAVLLNILPNTGGIAKQHPVSAPVGTTVSVTDLFGRLPVRKQVAIKESKKTLDKTLELLHTYAVARPQLKLLFKVLQQPKHNWSYAPKQDATVKEAIIQLFGVDLATHCFEKIVEVVSPDDENDSLATQQPTPRGCTYIFQAFIAKPGADPHHISKYVYFSVDGRPLSPKGGTIRKLLRIYTEYLRTAFQLSSSNTFHNYFIRLNILCPPGSYDVNIEPSKDDVLFSDENIIISGFRNICEEVYKPRSENLDGPLSKPQSNSPLPGETNINNHSAQAPESSAETSFPKHNAFTPFIPAGNQKLPSLSPVPFPKDTEISHYNQGSYMKMPDIPPLALKQATNISTQNRHHIAETSSESPTMVDLARPGFKIDMSSDHSERTSRNHSHTEHGQLTKKSPGPMGISKETEESHLHDLNPWIASKMTAPCKRIQADDLTATSQATVSIPTIVASMTPDPPILRHSRAPPTDLDFPRGRQVLRSRDDTTQQSLIVPGGPYRSPISSPIENSSQGMPKSSRRPVVLPQARRPFSPWSPPSSVEGNIHSRGLIANSSTGDSPDSLKQTQISFGNARANRGRHRKKVDGGSGQLCLTKTGEEGPYGQRDLQDMFTYARRNLDYQLSQAEGESLIPKYRGLRPEANSDGKANQAQPFIQLCTSTCQGNQRAPRDKEPVGTTLPDGDPRTYLLRRQRSRSANPRKLRRVKSSLMPLECVPLKDQTHRLVYVTGVTVQALSKDTRQLRRYDKYVSEGSLEDGLEVSLAEAKRVEGRLSTLIATFHDTGESGKVQVNLTSLLKGKGVAVED